MSAAPATSPTRTGPGRLQAWTAWLAGGRAVPPLALDFVRPAQRISFLGFALALAGLAAAALAVAEYAEAREDLLAASARQARWARAGATAPGVRQREARLLKVAPQARSLDLVHAQWQQPWGPLLRHVESPDNAPVVLLSLEAQTQPPGMRMVGEAAAAQDIVAYVGRLRTSGVVRSATITSQEDRQTGRTRVIRFGLDVVWGSVP